MNWNNFNTNNSGPTSAFETLNNQLFQRYIERTYPGQIREFRVINGSGGDGGIEAYAKFASGNIIAVQSKYFRTSLEDSEVKQIKKSITTAMGLRPNITEYIICVPHDVNSVKIGRGKVPTTNHEENKINSLVNEMYVLFPDLTITWWFDNELLNQLQQSGNEGILRYWFQKEVISPAVLKERFELQKKGLWLRERYVPELNADGTINQEYNQLVFSTDFRLSFADELEQAANKIKHCQKLLAKFKDTREYPEQVRTEIEVVTAYLIKVTSELDRLTMEVHSGNEMVEALVFEQLDLDTLVQALGAISPTHAQKPVIGVLMDYLREVEIMRLPQFNKLIKTELNQKIRLFLGRAGTGKTQGLASSTEMHLTNGMPAVIINAKETPCSDWTVMLSTALELPGWNKDEIFTALESMAHIYENRIGASLSPGEAVSTFAKILICIDGLEEDVDNQRIWCARMSETPVLVERYPRLRFMFSARDYFDRSCISDGEETYRQIELPREGDVPLSAVTSKYLSKYAIQIEDLSLIRGLDSLFGLRLFCEAYQGNTITSADQIITATRELLMAKVDRLQKEFINSLQQRKGNAEQPLVTALQIIADDFFSTVEIEQSTLKKSILDKIDQALNPDEIAQLLDFLSQNGILTREERLEQTTVLQRKQFFYRVTYQSIIDYILGEQLYNEIKNGKVDAIPARMLSNNEGRPNIQLIKETATRIFKESGKLIGTDGFLSEGIAPDLVETLRFSVLLDAAEDKAALYKSEVDAKFFGGPRQQFSVLKDLIIPSADSGSGYFGAEYLHDILSVQRSVFERDKLWSGLDRHEQFSTSQPDKFSNSTNMALRRNSKSLAPLLEHHLHNELPLVYAWGLTNIDRELRELLRIELARWALKRPEEFLKLLQKIFSVGDPQMQEDLASVALGISGHLDDSNSLAALARWAITNVFSQKILYRNVVVRQGFRALAEKALMVGAITLSEAEIARPSQLSEKSLLPLDLPLKSGRGDEVYPIVHDLAWYVLGKSYDNFLQHPTGSAAGLIDNDSAEAKALLDLYRVKYIDNGFFASSWAMAAAIGYIKNTLGFTRTAGNGTTDKSHGEKSRVYTYEEKYTWLAVHYINGYLADYVPWGGNGYEKTWISDYSKITEIPNPGEKILTDDQYSEEIDSENNWVVKENLAGTVDLTGNIDESIKQWVREEPAIDFGKWLHFEGSDFGLKEDDKWLALENDTSLHDSSNAGYSSLTAKAVLVGKSEFNILLTQLKANPDSIDFLNHLDYLRASPDTHIYANPSDIIWMNWIGENESVGSFFADGMDMDVSFTLLRVTKDDIDGEKYFTLPSRIVRELMGITSMKGKNFYDKDGHKVGFMHEMSDGSYRDGQKITMVDRNLFYKALDEKGLMICWAVQFFKQKNPLNDSLKDNVHDQRTWKYLVWEKDGAFVSELFWREYFSNKRDKSSDGES